MNNKTPITLLQEYVMKSKEAMPQYAFEKLMTGDFECTVSVRNIVTVGHGSTKQSAKHEGARKALERIGLNVQWNDKNNNSDEISLLQNSLASKVSSSMNFIGLLNELASINKTCYPNYQDIPQLGPFLVHCLYLKQKTEGTGMTKKAAKQEAARKMYEL